MEPLCIFDSVDHLHFYMWMDIDQIVLLSSCSTSLYHSLSSPPILHFLSLKFQLQYIVDGNGKCVTPPLIMGYDMCHATMRSFRYMNVYDVFHLACADLNLDMIKKCQSMKAFVPESDGRSGSDD